MPQKVYIKIPVSRKDFTNPPAIHWSPEKESKLWDVISTTAKRAEMDWSVLALDFGVPASFLQGRAYWMYERQLEELRNTIERGTLIDESGLPAERSERTIHSGGSIGLFVRRATPTPHQPQHNKHDQDDTGESLSPSSTLSLSSSEDDGLDKGSLLLQRSRILSKAPPKFKDLEEDEVHTEEDEMEKKTNTESSVSNLSSVSISKSALEEAFLHNSHF